MLINELEIDIPDNLIAIHPQIPRDESKLVIVDKKLKIIKFKDIIDYLRTNDAIIFNNTKVINAELSGNIDKRKVLVNLNKLLNKKKVLWSVFLKANRIPSIGEIINFNSGIKAKVVERKKNNNTTTFFLEFNCDYKLFNQYIKKYGKSPLPPYIKKKRNQNSKDQINYQTVFAKKEGAVAAPTASLHFSKNLIKKIKEKKIKIIFITLHVNGGTFIPIKSKNVFDHKMHKEFGEISKNSANKINRIKAQGGRIFAIGTTVLRLLESSKNFDGSIRAFYGETDIFIKPGDNIDTIDGLITNFHTPKSTLLVLIYAILGMEKTKKLYDFAIKKKLRFFSFGDACLIWNKKNES
ncbi:MAG: tRNA preQ1(34) S-adenosylmethionine ribosyltransferase-isomerase QueA [Alphaproteobacteria bacterium]